jgi:hypothetical protein
MHRCLAGGVSRRCVRRTTKEAPMHGATRCSPAASAGDVSDKRADGDADRLRAHQRRQPAMRQTVYGQYRHNEKCSPAASAGDASDREIQSEPDPRVLTSGVSRRCVRLKDPFTANAVRAHQRRQPAMRQTNAIAAGFYERCSPAASAGDASDQHPHHPRRRFVLTSGVSRRCVRPYNALLPPEWVLTSGVSRRCVRLAPCSTLVKPEYS